MKGCCKDKKTTKAQVSILCVQKQNQHQHHHKRPRNINKAIPLPPTLEVEV
jgi:hypothetical protein